MESKNTDAWKRLLQVLAVILTLAWLAFLFFQKGSVWDESEHAHVAWLISEGKRPITDFFQHHQPLLWHLLLPYFELGFRGAGVLLWGRAIVALCAVSSVYALIALGRSQGTKGGGLAGMAGVLLLMLLTLWLTELFVIRPETISTALILISLALWCSPRSNAGLWAGGAGALAAASFYASPRFILLGGLFVLLGQQTGKRWLLAMTGGLAFLAAYTLVSGFPLDHVVFNFKFSAFLQRVGSPPSLYIDYWIPIATALLLSLAVLVPNIDPTHRKRGALLIAYGALVFGLCHALAGNYSYPQAYAPFVVAMPLMLAWTLARLQEPTGTASVAAMLAALVVSAHAIDMIASKVSAPEWTLLATVRMRNALADLVPPGKEVLLYPKNSPISVRDCSYYGHALIDSRDRLCEAVNAYRSGRTLPHCDFLTVIRTCKPYLVDRAITLAVPQAEVTELKNLLNERYAPLNTINGAPLFNRRELLILRNNDDGIQHRAAGRMPVVSDSN